MTSAKANFLWGVATSSYQIEGAVDADGRGRSIWDTFCERPGVIDSGDTGRVACDHYNRWEEDLGLMKRLGVGAYRFSIAWPRIFPEGTGAVNQAGIDWYSRLVDGLLARGIEPSVTLYHWDLPQALEDQGGWRVREIAEAFADYAETMVRALGDRVRLWATHNEMPVIVHEGYKTGTKAPGAKEPEQVVRQVIHNLLLAHGLGVQAMRAAASRPIEIGIVHNPAFFDPFMETEEHIAAARSEFVRVNAWMMDPLMSGTYPKGEWEELGADVPHVAEGDMEIISQPLDFMGLNTYGTCGVVQAGLGNRPHESHFPRTDMDWPVTPDALYWAVRTITEIYAPKAIYITENGAAYPDQVNTEGRVDDFARLDFIRGYLRGVERAVSEGYPLRGYFLWSFLDNFEWQLGYAKRFGIVHVDRETQRRTPKASYEWYRWYIERQR